MTGDKIACPTNYFFVLGKIAALMTGTSEFDIPALGAGGRFASSKFSDWTNSSIWLLHGLHLVPHVENDFDSGEIHSEIAGQMQNDFEAHQIFFRVEARVAVAAAGLEQTFALIKRRVCGCTEYCSATDEIMYAAFDLARMLYSSFAVQRPARGSSGCSSASSRRSSLVFSSRTSGAFRTTCTI